VRIATAQYDWGNDLVEFQAIGTAVRAPSLRTPLGAALTNLSGQDVALLLDAGYRPVGVVGATSVFYGQLYTWGQPFPTGNWGRWMNVEMEGATQTWYHARHRVLTGLEAQATALGADGIVATVWVQHERPYEANDQLIGVTYTIHALATGIAATGHAQIATPTTALIV
jgi:uncharacterized protein YbjQ (UPF0145 family)